MRDFAGDLGGEHAVGGNAELVGGEWTVNFRSAIFEHVESDGDLHAGGRGGNVHPAVDDHADGALHGFDRRCRGDIQRGADDLERGTGSDAVHEFARSDAGGEQSVERNGGVVGGDGTRRRFDLDKPIFEHVESDGDVHAESGGSGNVHPAVDDLERAMHGIDR